jgi:ornithine cyclodeaminase
MPVSDTSTTAVKVATVPHRGDIQGAITVYSATGELQGILNAAEITAFRTALATMTLLTRWKVPKAPEMVVFGAGKQAEWHVRLALLLVPGIKKVTVINRSSARLEKFQNDVLSSLESTHGKVSFQTLATESDDKKSRLGGALATADIICCCTPSTLPLFDSTQLRREDHQQRFMSLIGSYKPEMQEVDTATIRLAGKNLYVDSKTACLEEAGELIKAGLGVNDVIEAGEVFLNPPKAQLDPEAGFTIFKCVGFALMDLSISQALLKMAEEKGIGMVVDSF